MNNMVNYISVFFFASGVMDPICIGLLRTLLVIRCPLSCFYWQYFGRCSLEIQGTIGEGNGDSYTQ